MLDCLFFRAPEPIIAAFDRQLTASVPCRFDLHGDPITFPLAALVLENPNGA